MRQIYAYMSSKLIGRPSRRDSDAELYDSDMPSMLYEPGPFFRKFREKFAKQLRELCGVDGEELVNLCKVKCFHSTFFLDVSLLAMSFIWSVSADFENMLMMIV